MAAPNIDKTMHDRAKIEKSNVVQQPVNGPRTMTLMGLWNDVDLKHSYAQVTNDLIGCWSMMTNAGVPFIQIIPWEFTSNLWTTTESNTWTSVTNFIVTNGGPYAALVQAGYIITNYDQTVDGLHANQTNLILIAKAVQSAYTPRSFYNEKTNSVGLTYVHAVTYLNQVASPSYMFWDGGVNMLGPFVGDSYIWSAGGSPLTPSFAGNYFQVDNSIGVGETADGFVGNIRWTGTATGNGAGLTGLDASRLAGGTVPLARLSGITSNQLDPETWSASTRWNAEARETIRTLVQRLDAQDVEIKKFKEESERVVYLERKLNELEGLVRSPAERNGPFGQSKTPD
jgi:hypothetical protein